MNWKRLLLLAVLGVVVAACVVYFVLPRTLKLIYVLDSAHAATIHPDGTLTNMTCPYDGSTLTRIVLIDEEGGADMPWRVAFICEAEYIFRIFNYWGGMGKVEWYGPFDGTWNETNAVATFVAAVFGGALIVVLLRPMRRSATQTARALVGQAFIQNSDPIFSQNRTRRRLTAGGIPQHLCRFQPILDWSVMSLRNLLLGVLSALLSLLTIVIGWTLLSSSYPTHSDVFWLGVQSGALAVLLVVCVSLLGLTLVRLTRTRG